MARVKIQLAEAFIYRTNLQIRVTDLNYGNHLANDAVLGLVHECRVQFYRHLGFHDERNIFGVGVIMADAAVQFLAEGFLGDELLIELGISDITATGYDLIYRISNQHKKTIALVKTGMVCFDYTTRKVARIPEEFLTEIRAK